MADKEKKELDYTVKAEKTIEEQVAKDLDKTEGKLSGFKKAVENKLTDIGMSVGGHVTKATSTIQKMNDLTEKIQGKAAKPFRFMADEVAKAGKALEKGYKAGTMPIDLDMSDTVKKDSEPVNPEAGSAAGGEADKKSGEKSDKSAGKGKDAEKKESELAKKLKSMATSQLKDAGMAVLMLGSEFETSFTKAAAFMDLPAESVSGIQERLLDLSDSSGIAASELSDSITAALQAGIDLGDSGEDAMKILEGSAMLAKAGYGDVGSVMSTTAQVLKDYNLSADETDKVQKMMFQSQKLGVATLDEMGGILQKVTPTAAAMNVSFDQVGAALATMSEQGLPATEAAEQLNAMLSEMGTQGSAAQQALAQATEGTEYAGMSFEQLMEAGLPISDVLNMMGEAAEENGTSLDSLFTSTEAGTAALALSGEQTDAFKENLSAMSTEADVVGEAFETVSSTSGEQFNGILNKLQTAGIELFDKCKPIIDLLLPILADLLDELLPPLLDMADMLIPVIVELLDVLLPPIMELVKVLLPPLVEIFDAFMPVISSVIGVVSELLSVALKPLIKVFETILSVVTGVMKGVFSVISGTFNAIKKVISGVIDFFKGLIDFLKTPINWIIDGINVFLKGINGIKIPDWVPLVGGRGFNVPLIPRLKKGMSFVPGDFFPAYLDYGERVLTREENLLFTSLGGLDGLAAQQCIDYSAMSRAWAEGLRAAGFVPGGGNLHATIAIDGREAAIVLTPYVSREMGFER